MPEEGSGSGFLWDAQGNIVTNNHVIEGAQRIAVSFGGDTSQTATVVGTDPVNDLAVIKVDSVPEGVRPLELGASTGLKVGQTAIVIGNPFGQFERTMTQGIVSAVNRTLQTDSDRPARRHPDRRGDQSRQLRRPAAGFAWPADRRELRHLLADRHIGRGRAGNPGGQSQARGACADQAGPVPASLAGYRGARLRAFVGTRQGR